MVLFVLPAEYDMDPTGLGEIMGTKGMSGYQVGALTTQATKAPARISFVSGCSLESVEYKYTLSEGQSMVFEWRAFSIYLQTLSVRCTARSMGIQTNR